MCDDDRGGITAEGLEMLRQLAEGEMEPVLIPRALAKQMYEQEMAWIKGDTPFQRMIRGDTEA